MERNANIASIVLQIGIWPSLCVEGCFVQLIEALLAGVVPALPGGLIDVANRRPERMFGYDRELLRSKPLEQLITDRLRGWIDLSRQFIINGASPGQGNGLKLPGMRKDDTEFPLEIDLHPLDLDDLSVGLGSLKDMRARQENDRETELKQRSHADLDEFVYEASHDLEAPLRAIA